MQDFLKIILCETSGRISSGISEENPEGSFKAIPEKNVELMLGILKNIRKGILGWISRGILEETSEGIPSGIFKRIFEMFC